MTYRPRKFRNHVHNHFRKRRKWRSEVHVKGLEFLQSPWWQQFIAVELLIGSLVVVWYMVSFFYQLGYKTFYHIPTIYMEYGIDRLLEPGKYISVSMITIAIVITLFIRAKTIKQIHLIFALSLIVFLSIIIINLMLSDLEIELSNQWLTVSAFLSLLFIFIIYCYILITKPKLKEYTPSFRFIPISTYVLFVLFYIIALNIGSFFISYLIQATQTSYYVVKEIEGNRVKSQKVILDKFDKYYIVAPLENNGTISGFYDTKFELVNWEMDEKTPPIEVDNDPLKFNQPEEKEKRLVIEYVKTGKLKPGLNGFVMEGSREPTSQYVSAVPGDIITVCASAKEHIGQPNDSTFQFQLYERKKPLGDIAIGKINGDQTCKNWDVLYKGNYQVLFTRAEDPSQIIINYKMELTESGVPQSEVRVNQAILNKKQQLEKKYGMILNKEHEVRQTPDTIGYFQYFKRSGNPDVWGIYWHPKIGAYEVHGAILGKWASLNYEAGLLGYPLTDENQTKKGDGRYSLFQGGAIYWYPERGAFVLYGPVLEKWRTTGAETGILGYPISDVSGPVTNQFAHFQKGTIRCNREQCKVEMNQ
jgi:hypothetical protein